MGKDLQICLPSLCSEAGGVQKWPAINNGGEGMPVPAQGGTLKLSQEDDLRGA